MLPTTSQPWLHRHYSKLLLALVAATGIATGGYYMHRKTPADYMEGARAMLSKGDLKSALLQAKNALQLTPADGRARLLLGRVLYARSAFKDAEKELTKARELGIKDDDLAILMTRTHLELNQFDQAVTDAATNDGMAPAVRATLTALRAKAEIMRGNQPDGEASLAESERILPGNPETLFVRAQIQQSRHQPQAALDLLEQALAKDPKYAEVWALKGNMLTALNRPAEAAKAFDQALSLAPGNIGARLGRIGHLIEAGAFDQAKDDLKTLREYAPSHIVGMYYEALIDLNQHRYQDGYAKIQPVVQTAPDSVPARLLAGSLSTLVGKIEEAQNHLNLVLASDPDNKPARRLLAETFLNQGQSDKASEIIAAIKDSDKDPTIAALRGVALLQQHNYADARRQLEQATAAPTAKPEDYANLASSELELGDKEAMFKALGKAAELDKGSSDKDLLLVKAYIKEKRYSEALKATDALGRKSSNSALTDNVRGVIYSAQGNFKQARASFEKSLATDPQNLEAATNLAYMDIQAKDFKSARSRLQELLKHAPRDSQAWMILAKIAMAQKDDAGIRENLESAKKADSGNVEARQWLVRYWLGHHNPGLALQEAREAMDVTGNKGFYKLIGLALNMQGDNEGTIEAMSHWAAEYPKLPEAQIQLGLAYNMAGKYQNALRALDQAIVLEPTSLVALAGKVNTLVKASRYADAIQLARDLQRRFPQAMVGYSSEADALAAQHQFLAAAQIYVKAAGMSGNSALILRAAKAYVDGGKSEDAVNALSNWSRSHPNDLRVREELAPLLTSLHRDREAVENYRAILQTNPNDPIAANNLALLLNDLKDTSALAYAEQAVKLKPDDPNFQDTLGWILVNNGQAKRGMTLLKQAFDKQPDSTELQFHYAKALVAIGEPIMARQELDRLLARGKHFPQEDEARKLMASLKR